LTVESRHKTRQKIDIKKLHKTHAGFCLVLFFLPLFF